MTGPICGQKRFEITWLLREGRGRRNNGEVKKSNVYYAVEIGGEMTKRGRGAKKYPGIKRESQKMSVYDSYAVIIVE